MNSKRRKIFIDCGYWTGSSTEFFIRNYKESEDFEIFGFECNGEIKTNLCEGLRDIVLLKKAVWISDGEVDLFIGRDENESRGSSLFKDKITGDIDRENPVSVSCIDFSRWIIDNFDKDDFIVCKMNIEGSEYDVLNKMASDGSLDYINLFFMGWHWGKMGLSKDNHYKTVGLIKGKYLRWTDSHRGRAKCLDAATGKAECSSARIRKRGR